MLCEIFLNAFISVDNMLLVTQFLIASSESPAIGLRDRVHFSDCSLVNYNLEILNAVFIIVSSQLSTAAI